jgi:mono/diheme cytochrome c family protein
LLCLVPTLSVLSQESSGGERPGANEAERERERERQKQRSLAINQGKTIFIKATCWGCHPHGENSLHGDKPLKGPAFEKKYKRDQSIVDFVRKGSPDAGMPPFPKDKLSDNDLKNVIVYLRSLSAPNAK